MKKIFILFVVLGLMGSCSTDLLPRNQETAETLFDTPESYKQFLARLYAGLAMSGQQGPAGDPDISGIDEGFSQYVRQYWKAQELSTDEAKIAWNDGNIKDYHSHNWNASNEFIRATYDRVYYQISICNEFLRQTTDAKVSDRGADATLQTNVQGYRLEARFLRALSYWHALDLFGAVPFVTEEDPIGAFLPEQASKQELFDYLVSELTEIVPLLPTTNEYGRATRGAAAMLLAKVYLNAETYVGTQRYSDVVTALDPVLNGPYSMDASVPYQHLFLADNDSNDASDEIIFSVNFDGLRTQTYGGMTFLVHAAVGGSMNAAEFGIGGGWGGLRTTPQFVDKFDVNVDVSSLNNSLGAASTWGVIGSATPNGWGSDIDMRATGNAGEFGLYMTLSDGELKFRNNDDWGDNLGDNDADGSLEANGANIGAGAGVYFITLNPTAGTYRVSPIKDHRGNFYTDGQNKEIEDQSTFTDGYAVVKYKNVDVDGNPGSDPDMFPDTDYPMFRLADAYLMYAEAFLRGASNADGATALGYVNTIRQRAYQGNHGQLALSDLTLDFLLDERGRELHWEGHRRTDLIRFGQFSTSGVWAWKGGVQEGATTEAFRDLYPIPQTDITANPNLEQNTGY